MNFLRKLFGDRRKRDDEIPGDRRRKGALTRWKESGAALDNAVIKLDQTVSMNMREFSAAMHGEMSLVHDSPWNHIEWTSFSESCKFRYKQNESSLAALCRNPEHPAHSTGIAQCSKQMCPYSHKTK